MYIQEDNFFFMYHFIEIFHKSLIRMYKRVFNFAHLHKVSKI